MKLLVAWMILFGVALVAWGQSAPPATEPSAPTTQAVKPLAADQMLSQMLRPTTREIRPLPPVLAPPRVDKKSGAGAVPGGAPLNTVLREGTLIVDRAGRLAKSANGAQFEFTFDSDGMTMQDPPVIILPSLKLMAMENAIAGGNNDPRFRITGTVTEYRGRNYILLEKVVIVPDAANQF